MKTMKAICNATVLALVLSVSAFAGDIASPGAPIPCPVEPSAVLSTTPTTITDASVIGSPQIYGLAGNLLAFISLF